MSIRWQETSVSPSGSHHVEAGSPLYESRFEDVLSFHEPGVAAVRDSSGAYHIDLSGRPLYEARFIRTFGFYAGLAAVENDGGAFHVDLRGVPLSTDRFEWCGNFQEGRCTVRGRDGRYHHIRPDGQPAYGKRWCYAGDYREGLAVVQDDSGLHRHIDRDGRSLSTRAFLDLDVFHKGFARARDAGGWFHVHRDGRAAYDVRFTLVEPFYNGQARCLDSDGRRVVIDERGQEVCVLQDFLRLQPPDWYRIGRFQVSPDDVLRRRAWGTVRGAVDDAGRQLIAKSTRARHDREYEALSVLQGLPEVPRLEGRVTLADSDWLFLERRPGSVLGRRNRCTPRPEARAIGIARRVLDVCARLHAHRLVHTDLQPANLLEAEDGTVTVLDYEHAVRLDARGLWSGELNWGVWEFVPPEQLADFTILDASADVYAVAVLLTYLVRGEVPFRFDVMATQASGGWNAVREEFRRLRAMPCLDGLSAGLRVAVEQVLLVPMEARPRAAQFEVILAGVSHA